MGCRHTRTKLAACVEYEPAGLKIHTGFCNAGRPPVPQNDARSVIQQPEREVEALGECVGNVNRT